MAWPLLPDQRDFLEGSYYAVRADGVLVKHRYLDRPPRYEYRLTDLGRGLLPVLIALQDWGSTWVLGDGTTSATTRPGSAEAHRVQGLVGTSVPDLLLPATDGPTSASQASTDSSGRP